MILIGVCHFFFVFLSFLLPARAQFLDPSFPFRVAFFFRGGRASAGPHRHFGEQFFFVHPPGLCHSPIPFPHPRYPACFYATPFDEAPNQGASPLLRIVWNVEVLPSMKNFLHPLDPFPRTFLSGLHETSFTKSIRSPCFMTAVSARQEAFLASSAPFPLFFHVARRHRVRSWSACTFFRPLGLFF